MRCLIVCVASKRFGYGHLKRSLILKKKLNIKFKVDLITFTEENSSKVFRKKLNVKNFTSLLNIDNLSKYKRVVLDISNHNILKKKFIIKHLKKIAKINSKKLVFIDGLNDEMIERYKIQKNILICPYFTNKTSFKRYKNTKYLIGPKYFIFDKNKVKEKKKIKKKIKNILITFGGSDLESYTLKIIRIISNLNSSLKITAIIGPFFKKKLINDLQKISHKNKKIKLIFSPLNLYNYFFKSDLVLCSSGITKYEVLASKVPSIIFTTNRSQFKYNEGFKKKNLTLVINYKIKDKIVSNMINNYLNNFTLRKKYFLKSNKSIDLNGCDRILKILHNK